MYPGKAVSLKSTMELLKSINFGSILDGTQKTLGVINQAIPIFYQLKPIVANAKTMFNLANIINEKDEAPIAVQKTNNSPIFYI